MSLKEWKNNELNKQLLKRFGILKEEKGKYDDGDGKDEKCDYVDCGDEDKKEKAGGDKKASKPKKGEVPPQLQKHVKGKKDDKEDKEEMEEGRNNPRTTNADKFAGHEDRYLEDRIHEEEEKDEEVVKEENTSDLQESIKRIARARKVFLNGKRIK